MKYTYLILLLFITFSCKTEEDKHPEMLFFEEALEKDFTVENVGNKPNYYSDTRNYVFFKTDNLASKKELIIYNKQNRAPLKTIRIDHLEFVIDSEGSIFGFNSESEKAISYEAPIFDKKQLEVVSLEQLSDNNLKETYASDIAQNKLDEAAATKLINEIRNKTIQTKFVDSLVCAIELYGTYELILKYPSKEIYVNDGLLFKGTFLKSKKYDMKDCTLAHTNLEETDYFGAKHLKLEDEITLAYHLEGSNHFVMGVSSNKLYYYEFRLNDKITKFKSAYPIKEIDNFEDQILLEMGSDKYKITTKK
ncbi:hypothetical protein I2486_03515 [Cellulophaga sp. E16_2]|uniref:hypothetical protein n=1 Tax=Cellulophaga sp. E16_2 TaxID=2789297 RepID=UPI001A91DD30|nr:hypothetical protein [Cellulophaga sp. E16_2]MBO0590467.1 hypothetical protein [Cellulophaga sp. E16_2]